MARSTFQPDLDGLASILAHLPEMVLVADPDGTILYLNRAQPGYSPDQFIGMNGADLVQPEHRGAFGDHLQRLRETGDPQEYEINIVVDGDDAGWFRTRMTPFGDPDESGLVLMVSNEITEEKRLEIEAERLRRLLPICSWCGQIRGEDGEWTDLQDYVARKEKTTISHGICPTCSGREFEDRATDDDANGSVA